MRKLCLFIALMTVLTAVAQDEVLQTLRCTNDYFMAKYEDPTADSFVHRKRRPSNIWTRGVYYEGLMALFSVDPRQQYLNYVFRWADFHRWSPARDIKTTDADNQCCAQTYIEYHLLTGQGTLEPVRQNLEMQMQTGRVDYWTWIDAIQMALPVYIKMYAVTGDRRYLDYGLKCYEWTRNVCGGGLLNVKERKNGGLWWRDKDYVPPYQEKDGNHCYWSRGNGWVYAALVRSMEQLPAESKEYKTLSRDFLMMSRALLACQHTDGFWRASLLSDAEYPDPEMTGTALFLYGMSWGIRHGLLSEKTYRAACEKAWQALASCVHEDGFLGWNQGTGKDPSAGQPVTFSSEPDFEDYGTGCFLLGGVEYYKLLKGKETRTTAGVGAGAWPDGTPLSSWFTEPGRVDVNRLGRQFVVTDCGVKNDSTLLQTEALQAVIDSVARDGGGVVVIPEGVFLSGALFFRPGTHLHLQRGAGLKGIDNIKYYPVVKTRMEGQTLNYFAALVNADHCDGFTITGPGTIDGNGRRFWEEFWIRRRYNPQCTNLEDMRPRLVYISNSNDVTVQDVHLQNSPFWTNHLYRCRRARYLGCTIYAPHTPEYAKAPSSDALDLDVCQDVVVRYCNISVNDDAVVLKGGKGTWADKNPDNGPNSHVLVENCNYGFVHGCVTLGSESLHDWNVILRNCHVEEASNVLWLKMRPDTPQHYEQITVEGLTGYCRNFLLIRPWTQFFKAEEREDMPLSECNNVTIRNIDMRCDNFFAVGTSDKYSLHDFMFENIRVEDGKDAFDPHLIQNTTVRNVEINGRRRDPWQTGTWPQAGRQARAGSRWWWLGSAVDAENLRWNLSQYASHGIGTLEITPIYGVQGNDANNIPFLSDHWMEMLHYCEDTGRRHDIQIDMNCGTGWPFGGPSVPLSEAACKAVFSDSITQFFSPQSNDAQRFSRWVHCLPTRQRVKRAAPGGEGWVIDHFDSTAVAHYLARFDSAFAASSTPFPATFFNDSYEVYNANWTPRLFDEFQRRRGYDLRTKLPELLGLADDGNQTLCDYRETLSDLLLENFTQQWVSWAHCHGVKVRNQAHGSPANLLDIYAAVDIPEIEGFGLSEFGIRGLRQDSGMTRKNDSDVSMLKYASSAAHVTGKPFTSSETFTWLTEHFRTSLSQMKPDLDLMFTCGVNRVFFHGTCYSPKEDPWPGWKFYASVDMSPTNSIWRDAPYLMQYIERCQSFLQMGQPDNDFLVYLPVRDMWRKRFPKKNGTLGDDLLMQFDIHSMGQKAPEFIRSILSIDSLGYDCDYISDRQLQKVRIEDGCLVTEGGTRYRGLIIPSGTTIDARLQAEINRLQTLVIMGEDASSLAALAKAEPMRTTLGLRAIRRRNDEGHHYFIANLTPRDIEETVSLAVPAAQATWYNPMNGDITPAAVRDGKIVISLRSGESRILTTAVTAHANGTNSLIRDVQVGAADELEVESFWTLTFTDETPRVEGTFHLERPQTWETLSDSAAVTMGTGIYETTFCLTREQARQQWMIDLGDVRESARVYINGQFLGCAWAAPFVLDCRDALRQGDNQLRIEVTNLPANRIRDLDRRGVKWRKFNEINIVDINYRNTTYGDWPLMKSGLNSSVYLYAK